MMGGSTPGASPNRRSRLTRACKGFSQGLESGSAAVTKAAFSATPAIETRSNGYKDANIGHYSTTNDSHAEHANGRTCNDVADGQETARRASKRIRRAPTSIYISKYVARCSSDDEPDVNTAKKETTDASPSEFESCTPVRTPSVEGQSSIFMETTVPYSTGVADVYPSTSQLNGFRHFCERSVSDDTRTNNDRSVPTPEFRVVCELDTRGHPMVLQRTKERSNALGGKWKISSGDPAREEDLSDQRFQRRHHTTELIERRRKKWGSYTTRFELLQNMRRIELEAKERREQKAILNVLPPKSEKDANEPPPPPPPFSFWPTLHAEEVASHENVDILVDDTLPVVAFGCAVPDLRAQPCEFRLPDSGYNAIIIARAKTA
eukprot:m.603451 g.603451  ORF g.603451 m.603451 type:complete len:378 (-) comp22453_c0_seq1:1259-2392(-)